MSDQMTWQIRWVDSQRGALKGFVGHTLNHALFTIAAGYHGEGLVLTSNLPGEHLESERGDDADALKVRAEEWLRNWLAKLGKSVLTEAAERASCAR